MYKQIVEQAKILEHACRLVQPRYDLTVNHSRLRDVSDQTFWWRELAVALSWSVMIKCACSLSRSMQLNCSCKAYPAIKCTVFAQIEASFE